MTAEERGEFDKAGTCPVVFSELSLLRCAQMHLLLARSALRAVGRGCWNVFNLRAANLRSVGQQRSESFRFMG